jgi:hypothetical protein
MELLESVGPRPRQARYQAALRPDRHCCIDSKTRSGVAATAIPQGDGSGDRQHSSADQQVAVAFSGVVGPCLRACWRARRIIRTCPVRIRVREEEIGKEGDGNDSSTEHRASAPIGKARAVRPVPATICRISSHGQRQDRKKGSFNRGNRGTTESSFLFLRAK